jgi:methyl-accepting chemotaxis protein
MDEIVLATTEQKSVAQQVADQMARAGARRGDPACGRNRTRPETCSAAASRARRRRRRFAIDAAPRSARIGENIETVKRTVEAINRALQEQSKACLEAAQSIEGATKHTSENDALAAQMGESARELLAQAELLRADVRRFQT